MGSKVDDVGVRAMFVLLLWAAAYFLWSQGYEAGLAGCLTQQSTPCEGRIVERAQ